MKDLLIYPYKMNPSDEISDGRLFPVPTFCRKNCSSETCHNFYLQNCSSVGIVKCPHGFAVDVFKLGEQRVIFTCLNVERFSDKESILRRIDGNDFLPRIPYTSYIQSKSSIISIYSSLKEKEQRSDNAFRSLHDVAHLASNLEWQAEKVLSTIKSVDGLDFSQINKLALEFHAVARLFWIRLLFYRCCISTSFYFLGTDSKRAIMVCETFREISEYLNLTEYGNPITIKSLGNIGCACKVNDHIDLLAYLVLDNAIKYSMKDKSIDVIFEGKPNQLIVFVKSVSRRPKDNEIPHLKERGFYSGMSPNNHHGKGMGLYIADLYCIYNDISLDIIVGDNIIHGKYGIKYSDFIVKLDFSKTLLSANQV